MAALVGAASGGIGLALYFRSFRELIPVELAGALVLASSFVSGVDSVHVARMVMPILGGFYGYFRAHDSNRQLEALAHVTPPPDSPGEPDECFRGRDDNLGIALSRTISEPSPTVNATSQLR